VFNLVNVFVLFLFQPFGTYNDVISYKFLRLFGYGLVNFLCLNVIRGIRNSDHTPKVKDQFRLLFIFSLYIRKVDAFNHSYFVVAGLG
jgi:hypothetical protein